MLNSTSLASFDGEPRVVRKIKIRGFALLAFVSTAHQSFICCPEEPFEEEPEEPDEPWDEEEDREEDGFEDGPEGPETEEEDDDDDATEHTEL